MNTKSNLYAILTFLTLSTLSFLCCKVDKPPHLLTDGVEGEDGIFYGYTFADTLTEHSGTEIEGYASDKAFNGVFGEGESASSLDVFVIGDSEYAIFEWNNKKIINGNGDDLKIFENGFYIGGSNERMSLDLGTVEVSKDGTTWHSFPVSYTDVPYENSPIGKFGFIGTEPVYINFSEDVLINPALSSAGGDAFDLTDAGIEKGDYIKYVKVIDGGETYPDGQVESNGIDIDGVCAFYWIKEETGDDTDD